VGRRTIFYAEPDPMIRFPSAGPGAVAPVAKLDGDEESSRQLNVEGLHRRRATGPAQVDSRSYSARRRAHVAFPNKLSKARTHSGYGRPLRNASANWRMPL